MGLGSLLHTVHLPAALATPPFTTALGTIGLHSVAGAGTSVEPRRARVEPRRALPAEGWRMWPALRPGR